MTKIKSELISDIDIHYFIEEEITGRISYICKRLSKANNKYMNNYDPTRAINTSCILMQKICMAGQ